MDAAPREVRDLPALVRRLEALIGMQTDERNRAQAGALTPAVAQSIETVLEHLDGTDHRGAQTDP